MASTISSVQKSHILSTNLSTKLLLNKEESNQFDLHEWWRNILRVRLLVTKLEQIGGGSETFVLFFGL